MTNPTPPFICCAKNMFGFTPRDRSAGAAYQQRTRCDQRSKGWSRIKPGQELSADTRRRDDQPQRTFGKQDVWQIMRW